jgi:transposase
VSDGWAIEAAADKLQVDANTVCRWRDRYLTEGEAGLFDRSSGPRTEPDA